MPGGGACYDPAPQGGGCAGASPSIPNVQTTLPLADDGSRRASPPALGRVVRVSNGTVVDIVECVLPGFPRLDPGTKSAVLADVGTFVTRQVAAIPDFLRYPYRLALAAFEWLPVFRWGLRFGRLDDTRRRMYLDIWATAPVGAMRNFVKLIRSCALLAFYDHPSVQAPLQEQVSRGRPEGAEAVDTRPTANAR